MAVPTFELFLTPTLETLDGGQTLSIHDIRDLVGWHFNLDEIDRTVMTRQGSNTQLHDRVTWAVTYLFQAKLVERPRRGHYRISDRGRDVLLKVSNGEKLTREFLDQFPEFREFKDRRGNRAPGEEGIPSRRRKSTRPAAETTIEGIERFHEQHVDEVIGELADVIRAADARLQRQLLARLLARAGYGTTPQQVENLLSINREGTSIEGELWDDPLRRSKVHVRLIRNTEPVGPESAQALVRLLNTRRINSGILIAIGGFGEDAREAVEFVDKDVSLLDADGLAEIMVEQGVGVQVIETYPVFAIESVQPHAQIELD